MRVELTVQEFSYRPKLLKPLIILRRTLFHHYPLSMTVVSEGRTNKLNKIQLELPLKSKVNRLEHLRLANHKVAEVDRLISEQEWKLKQKILIFICLFYLYVGNHNRNSSLVMVAFCYCCCCKCCKRMFPNFSKLGRTTFLVPT